METVKYRRFYNYWTIYFDKVWIMKSSRQNKIIKKVERKYLHVTLCPKRVTY